MNQELAGTAEIGLSRMPVSTTNRLKSEEERLVKRLEEVREAIAALEANPEIQAAIDAISKLGHF